MVRSYAPGFIFTTSLPPAIAAGALASVRHSGARRGARAPPGTAAALKRALRRGRAAGDADRVSHIVPVLVGDPVLCKPASDELLERHGIYVQPINYPTVPRGTERLRLTPSPLHDEAMALALVKALSEVWKRLGSRPPPKNLSAPLGVLDLRWTRF